MLDIKINDNEMYAYFEELLHAKDTGLSPEWKKDIPPEPYGMTDYDITSILESKALFYDQEDARQQICLLENMQIFLHEYIGIEGLEELMINNYGTIENSIFLEHDEKGSPVHTREHAKHQMKNAYLGSNLLLTFGYLEDMAKNIYQAESMTTQYLVTQTYNILKKDPDTEPQREEILKKLQELSYKIFMVSSLLHDIGYPLEFYLRSAQQLTDYPPYLKILSPTIKAEFSEIKAHLLGSQLFRQIEHEQIKEKYHRNNHGVLSAISLLMHFYYNGKIYALSREERCIIEMSAIAIYRHTDKFQNGFRMVYMQDPISYMVRLCDDLQEWERFKLLISDKHNYLQCASCGKLIKEDHKIYSCSCGKQYTKVTQIKNRKVNYICLCDSLSLQQDDSGKGPVTVKIVFDYMKQLEILLDDYTAVKRRNDDLEKVQKFVKNQKLNPSIKIDFFLSNNPILIIEEMIKTSGKREAEIENWIAGQEEPRKESLETFFTDYHTKKTNNPFGKKIETNFLAYEQPAREYVLDNYGEIYDLYRMLTGSAENKT